MSRWRRRLRKQQRPFIFFALVATLNFTLPQRVEAFMQPIEPSPAVVGGAVTALPQPVNAVETTVEANSTVAVVKPTAPKSAPQPSKKIMKVVATAYSSTRDQTDSDPFTTASGAKVHDGVIAMNGIPFGTRVRFPDIDPTKVYVVLDRMSAHYGRNRIDIWMPTRAQALQWGVRTIRMEII